MALSGAENRFLIISGVNQDSIENIPQVDF